MTQGHLFGPPKRKCPLCGKPPRSDGRGRSVYCQPSCADFSGETYRPKRDRLRLGTQLGDVFGLMKDGKWRTLRQIADITEYPEASVSARLRDFRKERFGGHEVKGRTVDDRGTWEFRLVPDKENT